VVLITGGSGYLGGRIADYLRNYGFDVLIGTRNKSSSDCFMDYFNKESLEKACNNVDQIIHLAGMNAQECEKNPDDALNFNGKGTSNLLDAAIKQGVTNFLYFSTAHVYQSPLEGNFDECTLANPSHPYSISNKAAEDYVLQAVSGNNLFGTVFRLTNAVGSPSSPSANCWMLVANDLCRQTVVNKNMQLHSSEYIRRDYLPISSICEVIRFSLLSNNFSGEVVNLSAGHSLSLKELSDLIKNRCKLLLGFTPSVNFINKSTDKNPIHLTISNKKLKEFCDPKFNLNDEIDNLILNCVKWFL
jgi:UDP-glucose 4-epimerase